MCSTYSHIVNTTMVLQVHTMKCFFNNSCSSSNNHTNKRSRSENQKGSEATTKHRKQHIVHKLQENNQSSTTSLLRYSGRKSIVKWKIIIPSIILFWMCSTSHVLAIRKGRLMSPSSFTALSGDLHVQIQFSSDEMDATTNLSVYVKDPNAKKPRTIIAEKDHELEEEEEEDEEAGKEWNGKSTTARSKLSTTLATTKNIISSKIEKTKSNSNVDGSKGHKKVEKLFKSGKENIKSDKKGTTVSNVESIIMSTLVISKYIDDELDDELFSSKVFENKATTMLPLNETSREQLLQRKRKEIVQNIPLFPDPRQNVTQIAVPCQTFLRGGIYEMQVITNLKSTSTLIHHFNESQSNNEVVPTLTTTTLMPVIDERLRTTLDVRWPSADMRVSPVRLRTYPDKPVEVTLRFPEVNCDRAWRSEHLPEFWLELVYCGKERTCSQLMPQNISKSSILYAEQVRGFPKEKSFKMNCELFGLAGNYAVQLRPMIPAPNVPITRRFLSVDWSDKFVFNVYARSIFPCDPHTGIGVLYEYPNCILEQGDRVRVYAKLRADVASLKPPTSLHYIAEQRVVKSQYSLYFNCDLFTEKYVEYCFVYVSQAISGAVADVRMDCVPTLPVSDSDTGGWGPWSEWTPCSTSCLGGTRNRYRFCDTPPPRYGAKFCEGPSVETEKCGNSIANTWDCMYETSGSKFIRANRTDVNQEIGPGCRCGCIVHLGASKPKRIIAGASQSCPGRSFWLIQVDGEEHISLSLNFLRLPCSTQSIKIRDGPSLSSTLLIELNGGGSNFELPVNLESTRAQLLVEFHAGEEPNFNSNTNASATATGNINPACTGGFLANVEQQTTNTTASPPSTFLASTRILMKSRAVVQKPKLRAGFTLVHLSAVVFASIIIIISALLGAQYVVRYRKYHLAVARRHDEGSRLHTPHDSMTSLNSPPSRAMSTTTLISEVIYMVKMRPKHQLRHSILRESIDAENLARETELSDSGQLREQMAICDEECGSTGSIVTLRNEIISPMSESFESQSPSTEEQRVTESQTVEGVRTRSGTLTRKDSAKDSESIVSSGMSSICNSPPMVSKRLSKYSDRYDAVTLKVRNSRMDDSMNDCDSLRSSSVKEYDRISQMDFRSQSASLTNGCYSPAASVVSTATIRTTNPKECKEKQNRKKLLARPGSEFSLGNQEELELDYYDYNVINAGAAPGSYLGMDPAYLIWIPPFDNIVDMPKERDEDKTPEPDNEPDETEPLYEEIKMPKYGHYLSPRSNTESSTTTNTSPISDELSPLNSNDQSKTTSPNEKHNHGLASRFVRESNSQSSSKHGTPYLSRKKRRQNKHQTRSSLELGQANREAIPMNELSGTKSARNIAPFDTQQVLECPDSMTGSYVEKETSVVKSPSDLQNFLALDDIQFADEGESDCDGSRVKSKIPNQTKDISYKKNKNLVEKPRNLINSTEVSV